MAAEAAADTTREGALERPARLQVVATGQFRLEARSHSCGEGYWTCRPLALITLNSLARRVAPLGPLRGPELSRAHRAHVQYRSGRPTRGSGTPSAATSYPATP